MIPKTKKLLAARIQENRKRLWDWHMSHAAVAPPPFYCSVDLRDSGHKVVPVDSNLFPAGFNNICPEDIRAGAPIFRAQIDMIMSRANRESAKKIMIIPESHTSNVNYIENLYYLNLLLTNAGYEVRNAWFGPLPEGSESPLRLVSATSKEVLAWPLEIRDGIASAGGFVPDLIILNNDFSGGYPELLDSISQIIVPSHTLGWHTRKKSEHFKYYNQLAAEFATIVDIDPWLIQIDSEEVGPVNFNEEIGTEEVAQSVQRILERTRASYEKHGITDRKPFAFVKNNSGTYGMGIMVVHDADELRKMNRRTKNKMSVGKNRMSIESVIVQEGIPTATLVDRLAAEPVIYLVGCELLGGFLRTNTEKSDEENLNSSGMVFRKLCMSDLRKPEDDTSDEELNDEPTLELVYGSIARISALATGMELQSHFKRQIR